MVKSKIAAIKDWIKTMGFELVKSHNLSGEEVKINYYSLGNFGIYEEISIKKLAGSTKEPKLRFISWNPWGVDFEVSSLKDLIDAYQDSKSFSPEMPI
ncbi:MAG: hypothetical protein Q8S11_11565 [Daejeonella sp.]|uniref:hypothetical protein n=1 Tax=Daejeonella sp. TaxID=2805397 RepID=UPI0027341EB4|nr:hypothetical protein [Daejeonella sp.]MDP3468966.1 hypothetical protein [Daejeonella sp.]